MSKRRSSTRRKSAQALAKKVWRGIAVLKNKDQTKKKSRRSSSISSSVRSKMIRNDTSKDNNNDDDDDRRTLSVSSQDSSQLELQAADGRLDEFIKESNTEEEEEKDSCCLSQSMDAGESNRDGTTELGLQHEHDDSDTDEMKDTNSLPLTVLQVNLDESAQGDGSVHEGVSKAVSEDWLETMKLNDNTSSPSRDEEDASTLTQLPGIDQPLFLEESYEENAFVEGAAVLSQSMNAVESNQDVTELGLQHEHDDSDTDEMKDTNSLPLTVLQVNLDESAQGDGSVHEGVSKAVSEDWLETMKLNDNTSSPSRDEEDASTLTQSPGIDQPLYLEESYEENVFVEGAAVLSQSMDTVESNQDVTELGLQQEHDDSDTDEMKDTNSLPLTVLQVNLDESAQGDGSVHEGVSKAVSEDWLKILTLNDNTSSPSRDEEDASTLTQPPGIDQPLWLEESYEENVFVEGAAVHIIKGTNNGKCGIISRTTSKCVFISISGFDEDVRKTKSNEFLKIVDHHEINNKHHNFDPQEGNFVRIKKGVHTDCHGIISRITEKCVYISIGGLHKDVRKKKSTEFLELLNDGSDCAPQDLNLDKQASSGESSELSVFVVGKQVRIVKGSHLGQCGVISRVTNKSVFVSIMNMPKDIRKMKSDQFLHIVDPVKSLMK